MAVQQSMAVRRSVLGSLNSWHKSSGGDDGGARGGSSDNGGYSTGLASGAVKYSERRSSRGSNRGGGGDTGKRGRRESNRDRRIAAWAHEDDGTPAEGTLLDTASAARRRGGGSGNRNNSSGGSGSGDGGGGGGGGGGVRMSFEEWVLETIEVQSAMLDGGEDFGETGQLLLGASQAEARAAYQRQTQVRGGNGRGGSGHGKQKKQSQRRSGGGGRKVGRRGSRTESVSVPMASVSPDDEYDAAMAAAITASLEDAAVAATGAADGDTGEFVAAAGAHTPEAAQPVAVAPVSPETVARLRSLVHGFVAAAMVNDDSEDTVATPAPTQLRLLPTLTREERAFVHGEAETLGLGHVSVGRGPSRQLVLLRDPQARRALTAAEEEVAALEARRAACAAAAARRLAVEGVLEPS